MILRIAEKTAKKLGNRQLSLFPEEIEAFERDNRRLKLLCGHCSAQQKYAEKKGRSWK